MKTNDIRNSYLDFFVNKSHKLVQSDSLIPQDDPTLLFTGAGMNQFKDYFMGIKKDYSRATTAQKCLRTGDLEEVGKTAYHHSFFEMLGNFSFGDYFKRETILWAWEYLTEVLKIDPSRLRVSVHRNDEEAFRIWRDEIKLKESWIYKLGDKGNFWPSNAPEDGPNGPCGPCSEIYYDQHPDSSSEDIESSRFAEIWNLVFTQFDRRDKNELVPLAQKNIDTGMGLERLACVLQGKATNYEIDIFQPLNAKVEACLGKKVEGEDRKSLYAISDHARAAIFSIADGVIPSNEGRGYVIRKIIRRALWHALRISDNKRVDKAFLYQMLEPTAEVLGAAYPEIIEAQESVTAVIQGEEERFLDTLETGIEILDAKLKLLSHKNLKKIPGADVFELYDTYGFPDELTRMIAESKDFQIDQQGFNDLMAAQRKRAKDASQISSSIFVTSELEQTISELPRTKFIESVESDIRSKVLYASLENDEGILITEETPFYAESGGQVGDTGNVFSDSFEAEVKDTQKTDDRFIHQIKIVKGSVKEGDFVNLRVNTLRRYKIMRNHTATHLLHATLRNILGPQVRQLGSLVSDEKLRFDYSYSKPLTVELIQQIEAIVNEEILKNTFLSKKEMSLEDAKKEGALAFFGDKYGEKVRVVTVPDFSKEFCGGTHCDATGQIGSFVILSDSSVASGARRIEAITGSQAFEYLQELRRQSHSLAKMLKTTPAELETRVQKLQSTVKKMEKDLKEGVGAPKIDHKKIIDDAKPAGVFKFASFTEPGLSVQQLRAISDSIKSDFSQMVYLIASENNEKVDALIGISSDLKKYTFDVRELLKEISPLLGVSGGGRPDLVQAGGKNVGQLKEKWNEIISTSVQYLKNTDIEKVKKG